MSSAIADGILKDYGHVDNAVATLRIGGDKGTDVGAQVGKDLAVAEAIAVPITLILLVIAFGSIVAALLPLGIALIAIFGTFAELSLLTHVTSVSIFAINLTTALGLGLGIDYALLIVSRFREELAAGADVVEAVGRTTATAGTHHRVLGAHRRCGPVGDAGLPGLLPEVVRLRRRRGHGLRRAQRAAGAAGAAGRSRTPGQRRSGPGISATRSAEAPFWGRLAEVVMRRPVLTAGPVIALLLVMAAPLLGISFATPDERVLPKSTASSSGGRRVARGLRRQAQRRRRPGDARASGSDGLDAYKRKLRRLAGRSNRSRAPHRVGSTGSASAPATTARPAPLRRWSEAGARDPGPRTVPRCWSAERRPL